MSILVVMFLGIGAATLLYCGMAQAEGAGHDITVDGITPYQTLQCDESGLADIVFRTDAPAAEARLVADGADVVPWTPAGNEGTIRLPAAPAGGPYTVEVRAQGTGATVTSIDNILVGDLWVLAGQSNMQGIGNMIDVAPPSPQVNVFRMNYMWDRAEEPLHRLAESPDAGLNPLLADPDNQELQATAEMMEKLPKGAGLGLPFAHEMVARTGRPVGLVPCALGGTSMDQWDPKLKDMGGGSLYGALCKRVATVGGKVRGILWYQGESDAGTVESAAAFPAKFEGFVERLRADLGAPELPFYYVQIGRVVMPVPTAAPWDAIQHAQYEAESRIPHCGMVTAVDLGLEDLIHVGTPALKTLGHRLANLALRDLFAEESIKAGPRLAGIERAQTPYAGPEGMQLIVRLSGVNGKLIAEGRPSGFSLSDSSGNLLSLIFRQELDGESVILWLTGTPPDGAQLWYGRGLDPYCNIVDERDMALPAFGPVALN